MDLFVINRHGEEKAEVGEEEEKAKLSRILKQIEKKKRARIRQRERQKQQKAKKAKPGDEEQLDENTKPSQTEECDSVHVAGSVNDTVQSDTSKPESVVVKSFTVLGAESIFKKTKAERVLPQWLANPTPISTNLQNLSVKVSKVKGLDKLIRKKLKANGIKYFFPVQAEVIPFLLEVQRHGVVMFPRDVYVSAPTGSGKTLAFVLPVIQALKHHTVRKIRALVILPTQDLADQVFRTFKTYAHGTNIECGVVSGKHLFDQEQKQLVYFSESFGYISKVDILVSTAGRLVSHLKSTQGFNLQSLEFLIIDEADRVLETVQDDWLYHLDKHISQDEVYNKKILNVASLAKRRAPQKLLFSATLTQDPEKIEKLSLFQPKLFSCVTDITNDEEKATFTGKFTTPKELMEKYIVCTKELKPLVLYEFIKRENLTKTIIFTHSVESAHRLKILLRSLFKSKLKVDEISSSLKGKSRDSLIADFSKGDIDLLICTDSLARGIDLPGVKCVVSYSAPKYLKTYVHRVGRTARAGELGSAVTLLHKEQFSTFKSLLVQLKKTDMEEESIDEEGLKSRATRYRKALNQLKEIVKKEEKSGKIHLILKKKSVQSEKKLKNAAVSMIK